MIKYRIFSAFLGMAAFALQAAPYRFDFSASTQKSKEPVPLREGFVRLDSRDNASIKWLSKPATLKANYQFQSHEWHNDGTRNSPPSIYSIDITHGNIQGSETAEFLLPGIAAGEYKVWVLSGYPGGNRAQVWDTTVKIGGKSVTMTFPGQFGILDDILDATAEQGGLKVTVSTRSKWVLSAMALIPKNEWPAAREGWLAELQDEIFVLPPDVKAKWKHTPQLCKVPEPRWTDLQKKAGFAVYTRPWSENVWDTHYPEVHEFVDQVDYAGEKCAEGASRVRAFGAWGEYEPLTFTIYPLKGFEACNLTVSDLTDSNGRSIPKKNIDVRYVRYLWARPNYNLFFTYYRVPDMLMPWNTRRLIAGENLRIWLTVKTPSGIPGGIYRGTAEINADGVTAKVPLAYRVLPYHLEKDESIVQGQYYHHPYDNMNQAPDNFSREWWEYRAEKEHEDMRECGMNTLVLSIGASRRNGKYYFDFDKLQAKIDLYRKYGFNKPVACSFGLGAAYYHYIKDSMGSHLASVQIPPEEFFQDITAMVTQIQAEVQRRQWPELLYYPIDEPSTSPTSVEFMRRTLRAIKKVPGARTYITADPAHEQFEPLRPYVDVWCCQPFSVSKEKVEADMKARSGLEYWCYPNHISGENDHTPTKGARMTYGYGFWQSGFRCLIPWIYESDGGNPWNNLDSRTADFCNRFDQDGSPIPNTLWVAYREGLDDGRYIYTLGVWADRAEAAGFRKEAEAARADLELIRKSLKLQPKYKFDDLWSGETMDVYRWMLAQRILELKRLF